MGRPKGSTNKVVADKPVAVAEPEVVETKLKVEPDGSVDLGDVDIRNVAVQSRKRVSLTNPDFDPFTKFKTDPSMYYRAINVKPHNVRKREAEGYKTIPGSEYGDLVLAKLPKEVRVEREDYIKEKTKGQTRAAVERFKEDSAKSGVKAYEEK
jgi:hypothetical protein